MVHCPFCRGSRKVMRACERSVFWVLGGEIVKVRADFCFRFITFVRVLECVFTYLIKSKLTHQEAPKGP